MRQKAIAWLAGLLVVGIAFAAEPDKTMRVGVLLSGSSTQWSAFDDALAEGLRERGYIEGRNLVIVRKYGELSEARIKSSAAELSGMQLDTIVTSCTATTRSAASSAPNTPIVIASLADPVAAGLVQSLAHPGGNITGRASQSTSLTGKRLSLLREVLPPAVRSGAKIAVLMNGKEPSHRESIEEAERSAKALDMSIARIDTTGPGRLAGALEALAESGAKGLLVYSDDPGMIENRERIAAAAIKLKLPSISGPKIYADAGGLMSYGMDMRDDFRLSASYVVKVANGAKPANLPIELPTTADFTLNMRTAQAMGLAIPRELRLQAHTIIE